MLHAGGLPLRLVVRDPTRLDATLAGIPDVQRASGYAASDEMRDAFAGVATVFLIPAAESADRVDQHRATVQAAVQAKAQRIVYLSFVGAAEGATFTLARDHWHTEQAIRGSGLEFAFLRMSLYMDFLPMIVGADGAIRGPAGSGRLAAISRDDVAASCAAVLASPEAHVGKTWNLTGREAFSMAEAASLLSTPRKPVRYVDETDEEAWASRQHFGAPEWENAGLDQFVPSGARRQPGDGERRCNAADRPRAGDPARVPGPLTRRL